ncbi:hypothetical protein [Streptomyces sp. CC224B]|uniref:hypothetical protein n=1 Tax=Streptomyces sp. CC224B TaxID=3044571 RepID=UPI0024A816A9|nr:hypothetical protein [Streptomyces sp. CC224B]
MPAPRADLIPFADALTTRPPGDRHSTCRPHEQYNDQFPLDEEVWDNGHVY